MVDSASLYLALMIFLARVVDVSLGTLRHALVVRGKRALTFVIAFVESIIWVFAVSRVINDLSDPLMAIAFAFGFAAGTFVGITLESILKIGDQVVKVFTQKGSAVAQLLREQGFRVTEFQGNGRDGTIYLLFVQVPRRSVKQVMKLTRSIDPTCYLVVEDIKMRAYA
ncbi:DUF5698 domain-containing protein [uncultured Sphaerochaeta sp.]|uniref:DUF5698 domain-containing protein n=1 Tax=uncultured Sphaerochaeta sp. TaxID=886478 RepID=UPI002AA8BDC6|nr:DUF5698 domain-containing protein [uncultured Sphaerochaeta sp.]